MPNYFQLILITVLIILVFLLLSFIISYLIILHEKEIKAMKKKIKDFFNRKKCCFCQTSNSAILSNEKSFVIEGPKNTYICSECVLTCSELIEEKSENKLKFLKKRPIS